MAKQTVQQKTFEEYSLDELTLLTSFWHRDRGITANGTVQMQFIKFVEESGELAAAIAKKKPDELKDAIGDCLVLLNIIAELSDTSLKECWNHAYQEIKDRKGFLLSNGNFIKDSDPRYEEIVQKDIDENKRS